MSYCTTSDVQNLLTNNTVIGPNKLLDGANVTSTEVQFFIDNGAAEINAYLSAFYRVPLMKNKVLDYTAATLTFTETYPGIIILINTRLAAANVFDKIFMAQQEPNVSEWGKNQRALAYDDLKMLQAGAIQLQGQERMGNRFCRSEIYDPSRMPSKDALQLPTRESGK